MPVVDKALYVEGVQVGAAWQFSGRVFVEAPPGSGTWRKAIAGEVEVELKFLGEWWQVPISMETLLTNASGNVSFAGSWQTGSYTMEARHLQSGDKYKVRFDCHDDGTYDTEVEIE
ncbi:hypothetical protein LCGC14_1804810 [marine sediment metagenome]|uniref:Uncharacterized protein n=1 Tax=marine sediment metagenome TaxID=412755 RepID=A0A0F9GNG0_9ZZZZ